MTTTQLPYFNSDRDIRNYRLGQFVALNDAEISANDREYGFVSGITTDTLQAVCFCDGFPHQLQRNPRYGYVRRISKTDALPKLNSISQYFEEDIKKGELSGAVAARKQFYLNGMLRILESKGVDPNRALRPTNAIAPLTGLYVLVGVYSGQGPSEHLDGVTLWPERPRLEEIELSRLLYGLKPLGFGNIPGEVNNTPATSHGDLVAYWAYEVPEKARHLVKDPKVLERDGTEWRFVERLADGRKVATSIPI